MKNLLGLVTFILLTLLTSESTAASKEIFSLSCKYQHQSYFKLETWSENYDLVASYNGKENADFDIKLILWEGDIQVKQAGFAPMTLNIHKEKQGLNGVRTKIVKNDDNSIREIFIRDETNVSRKLFLKQSFFEASQGTNMITINIENVPAGEKPRLMGVSSYSTSLEVEQTAFTCDATKKDWQDMIDSVAFVINKMNK